MIRVLKRSDDIIGYTFRAEMYTVAGIVAAMIDAGEASPAARDMAPEDVLDQIAGANAIDRDDESSFDSGEFPKVVLRSMCEAEELFVDADGLYVEASEL